MASLQKDPRTGLYYAQFYDRHRRPQRKTIALRTKHRRTAERVLVKLVAEVALGSLDPWSPKEEAEERPDLSTLGAAVDAYLASYAHLKPKTIKTYEEVLVAFKRHVGESFSVRRIDAECVLDWLNSTSAGDVTRRKYVHHLGYLFRYLIRAGAVEQDVSKKVPLRDVPERAPKATSEVHVARLLETIRAYNATSRGDYSWLERLIGFNVHVGLRRGELIHLQWGSVDLDRRLVRVRNDEGFTTKSSRERTIPLCDPALAVLRDAREKSVSRFVFHLGGRKLNHNTLTRYFKRFSRLADLPEELNLHSTRHTFGTRLAERGVPVVVIQELMGHRSVRTTERYMSVRADIAEEWVRRAFASGV